MASTIIDVANAEQLKAALAAYDGDTIIVLKDGDYGSISIRNTAKVGDLKLIAAADSDPTMTLRIVNAHDVALEGITFKPATTKWGSAATVTNSKDVSFVNNDFVGIDSSFTDLARGLSVTNSKDVLVADNDFSGLMRGAVFTRSDDLKVLDNDFRDMRSEGMNFAGVQRVEIGYNTATDFRPAQGDHPDFIQFWTNGMTRPSTDIRIHDNVALRGDGGGSQGIYIDNDNHVPYRNVVIENNTIQTDYPNGIAVVEAEGLVIRDNVALSTPDAKYKTQIRIVGSEGVEVVGNQSNALTLTGNRDVDQSGNTIVDRFTGSIIDYQQKVAGASSAPAVYGTSAAHESQPAGGAVPGLLGDDASGGDGAAPASGAAGNDGPSGGTGADRFVFGGAEASSFERPADFANGADKIAYQAVTYESAAGHGSGRVGGLDPAWFTASSSGDAPDAHRGAFSERGPVLVGTADQPLPWHDGELLGGAGMAVATFAVVPEAAGLLLE